MPSTISGTFETIPISRGDSIAASTSGSRIRLRLPAFTKCVTHSSTTGHCGLRRNFVYDCAQAGFSNVQVWRHTYESSQGAAGVFLGRVEPESLPALEKWSAYLVACRD